MGGRPGISSQCTRSRPSSCSVSLMRATLYGKRIARTSIDEISKLGFGTAEQQEAWLASRWKSLFPDVHEGTHISGVYPPARRALLPERQPARRDRRPPNSRGAFFAIWLDPRTSAARCAAACSVPRNEQALTFPALLSYGLFGLPLALVALPIYVYVPQFYAQRFGLVAGADRRLHCCSRASSTPSSTRPSACG